MRMRATWRSFPAVLAAVLYVLLGVSAAWHAPHFSHDEAAVHTDRHTGGHETPAASECALCTWKTGAQELASSVRPTASLIAFAVSVQLPPEKPVSEFLGAALARGPPALS